MNERLVAANDIRCLAPPAGWLGEAQAFLSLREGGVSPPPFATLNLGRSAGDALDCVQENERRLATSLGLPGPPARLRLDHGSRCLVATEPGTYGPADALLTDRKDLPLWLTVGDCLPIYLVVGSWIALLHAGWRGTASGAIASVVEALGRASGLPVNRQRAWIGPGIQMCCYPVRPMVAERFAPDLLESIDGKRHLDLTGSAIRALQAAGLPRETIRASRLCTSCRGEMFFSYRRDGSRSGRMAAVLWR